MDEPDYVPTKMVSTLVLETASDDWFADVDGDGIPAIAIGRLPARTPEQAAAMANKIVGYERAAAGSWSKSVSLVADQSGKDDDPKKHGREQPSAKFGMTRIGQESEDGADCDFGVAQISLTGDGDGEALPRF